MSTIITERETKLSKSGRIHKSSGANWGLETTISAGGKWKHVANCKTLEQAKAVAAIHSGKGRKYKIEAATTSKSGSKKHHVPLGTAFFRVNAYVSKSKQVNIMMTRQECLDAGVEPGSANN